VSDLAVPSSTGLDLSTHSHLVPLATEAVDFAANARSEATRRAYASDWTAFTAWTDENGLDPLPADPAVVALYATHLARAQKPSTIGRKMASITAVHEHHGHTSPTRHPAVRDVLAGVRRSLGVAPTQVAPAVIGEIRRMVAHLPDTVAGKRDRAVLLAGFAGALRRSELVALEVADLERRDEGYLLRIRRSKGDQEAAGQSVALPFGHDPETCPVKAIEAWLEAAEIAEGPLFRPVNRGDRATERALSPQSVALIVKRAAESAGLDPDRYSGHSLRAGFATTAAANGANERQIASQTRHKNLATVAAYVRHASRFSDNAVTRIGL
jgi:site-specific recombinase XerD